MSGRGNGGKGLGKEETKRRRKMLGDSIQYVLPVQTISTYQARKLISRGITEPAIQRLAGRG